ncbi:unnamed protein product [Prunus armeniaca]
MGRPKYTILIFAYPVGNYHKGRATLNLYVEDKLPKATPGGTGGVKSITNYSPAASSSFMQVISFSVGFDGLGWAYAPLPTQNKANLATHD